MMTTVREAQQIFKGVPTSDGAGVQLTRIIGSPGINMLDPFLLLDAFNSDQPQDYIAGFPAHPHRGFETVTYMLAGKMRHKDNHGNIGLIESGGVQWMTAGSGIIHSEMPEQENGLLSGFQLWVNLPASDKMTTPRYQEKSHAEIPVITKDNVSIKVIAGKTQSGHEGVIKNSFIDPIYWDVHQGKNTSLQETIQSSHNGFIYVYEGTLLLGRKKQKIRSGELAVLTSGDSLRLNSESGAKYLLIAGKPLNEPVARGGPFVMNTREEVNQAFKDYQQGVF